MVVIFGHIIEKYLYIKKGEEKKVSLFLIFFSLLIVGQEIGLGVSVSVFLTRIGIEQLPKILLLSSLISTFGVLGYVVLSSYMDNKSLFYRIIIIGLILIIQARLMEPKFPYISSYIMFIAAEFMFAAVNLHFSTFLADYLHTRQSKRLVPVIFSGSRIGGITGGIILIVGSKYIGSINLIFVWTFFLVLSCIVLKIISQTFSPSNFDYEKKSKESKEFFINIKNSIKFFKGSNLLKSLAAGTFLIGFLSIISKYLYNGIFVSTFPKTDQLTAFLGLYTIAANILGLIIQLVIANRIIDYFGLGAANLLYSITLSSSFAFMSFFSHIYSAIYTRFTDEHFESAIRAPVESMMYNAITDRERARARALSSGLVKPISEIAASLFLSIIRVSLNFTYIAVFGFILSIFYLVISLEQNKGYVESLMKMIQDKTFSLDSLRNLRWEKASRKDLNKLYKMAGNQDQSIADSAALLLLNLDEDINFKRLNKHFFIWSTEIQQGFLTNYFRRSFDIEKEFLIKALNKCQTAVKLIIIEYLIETSNDFANFILLNYLNDKKSLKLQNSAIRFFYITNNPNKEKSLEIFKKRLDSDDPEVIFANFSIIQELYEEEYIPYILKLSKHKNREIAREAINTLSEIYQPRGKEEPEILNMADELIKGGSYYELKAAVKILSKRTGIKERDKLIKILDTNSAPLRDLIISILANNYSKHINLFYELLESDSVPLNLKENLILLLQKIEKNPNIISLKKILKKLIDGYFIIIKEQEWLTKYQFENSLMAEMNERKKNQIRIIILQILGILLHQKVILSIEKALLTKNPRLISNAMELFENIWDKKQAKGLITLLHPESYEEELKISNKFYPEHNVNHETFFNKYLNQELPRWEICSSLLLLKDCNYDKENLNIESFLKHPDPLVREITTYCKNKKHTIKGNKNYMLTTIEKVIFLKNAPLFKSLRMDELKMVADIVKEEVYDPGEIVITKGDVGNAMFIIASGEIEIYLPGDEEQMLTIIKESSFFGEMALFGDEVRSASARALKPTKLLLLEREHFLNLIYEKPQISIEIIKVLSSRLRRMDNRVKEENVK